MLAASGEKEHFKLKKTMKQVIKKRKRKLAVRLKNTNQKAQGLFLKGTPPHKGKPYKPVDGSPGKA